MRVSLASRRCPPMILVGLLLVVVLVAGTLASCSFGAVTDTNVNEDGSGTFKARVALDSQLQGLFAGSVPAELSGLFGGLLDLITGQPMAGWQTDKGTDPNGTSWVSMSRSFATPEEFNTMLAEGRVTSALGLKDVTLKRDDGPFTTSFTYSAALDVTGVLQRMEQASGGRLTPEMLSSAIKVENRVTLPGEIKQNNAKEVDGNTLVWDLTSTRAPVMSAKSVIYNWDGIVGAIAGGLALLALIGLGIVFLVRRSRRSSPRAAVAPATGTPVAGASAAEVASRADATAALSPADVAGLPPAQVAEIEGTQPAALPPATEPSSTPAISQIEAPENQERPDDQADA